MASGQEADSQEMIQGAPKRAKNFVERVQAGEIWSRYTDEKRRGEFVLFDRIVVSGNLLLLLFLWRQRFWTSCDLRFWASQHRLRMASMLKREFICDRVLYGFRVLYFLNTFSVILVLVYFINNMHARFMYMTLVGLQQDIYDVYFQQWHIYIFATSSMFEIVNNCR